MSSSAIAEEFAVPDESDEATRLQELKDADPDQSYLIEVYGRTYGNYTAFQNTGQPDFCQTFRSFRDEGGKWCLAIVQVDQDEVTLPTSFDTWEDLCDSLVWQMIDREKRLTDLPGYAIWDFVPID